MAYRKSGTKRFTFLKELDYGMLQPKEKPKYLVYFYKHQVGKVLILDETIDVIVKNKKIIRCTRRKTCIFY